MRLVVDLSMSMCLSLLVPLRFSQFMCTMSGTDFHSWEFVLPSHDPTMIDKSNLHATNDHREQYFKLGYVEANTQLVGTTVDFYEAGNVVMAVKWCNKTLHRLIHNVTSVDGLVFLVLENPVKA